MNQRQFENKIKAAFPAQVIEFKHGRTYNRAYVNAASGVRCFDNVLNSQEINVYGASGCLIGRAVEVESE